jgi:EmrB/QacA subfamily drug resistance transporter
MTASPDGKVTDKGRQRWIVASAAFASFMVTLDEFIVGISLPAITQDFGIGTSQAAWVTIAYFLMVTSLLIPLGKVADRWGLKQLFILGYAIFLLGSLLCGIANSIGLLVAFRLLQGIGGAIMRVVAYAMVPKLLPLEVRGWGYGILSTASASGIMIGAPVGGLITSHLSWHWIFLVNIPIGLIAIAVVMKILPEDRPRTSADWTFDLVGAIQSFVAICALTYALNSGNHLGWGSPLILTCLLGSAILLVLFIRRERSLADPLIDLHLFNHRGFLLGIAALFMTCLFMGGDGFLFPFFLQWEKGLEPAHAGLVILAYSAIYIPAAQFAGRLSDRVNPALLCGFAMLSATLACLMFVGTMGVSGLWWTVIYMLWAAVSCAMFISPCNKLVMSHAPEQRMGSASGILSTANQLSGVLGISLFEAIFSWPGNHAGLTTLAVLNDRPDLMTAGFQLAYVFALLVCAAAAGFSFLNTKHAH